ncbi:MAG: methionine adenosyltransferase [Nitrospiraceae bacterium]
MSHGIVIQESPTIPAQDQRVEIVERKGKGHPDTICDAVAERISTHLSRAYSKTFGRVLHHNIDKGLLVAGQVDCRLGGGDVLEPMRLIIGDRATEKFRGKSVPVAQIAVAAARDWFKQNLPHADPDRHIHYQVELKATSSELGAIFERRHGLLVANDTSAGVGYAPFTPTERLVIDVEHFLNGPLFKGEFPETGEDVKVMALRFAHDLTLTVAMPFLAGAIHSEAAYFRLKARVLRALQTYVQGRWHGRKPVRVSLNALDRRGKGLNGMYLSLLGTSAEQGDSGQIGRGNRVCGVIPINRPMSGEAAAGKNAISHVGKIYNVLAHELASRIHCQVHGVREVTVWLCSTIGQRIDRPSMAVAQVSLLRGITHRQVQQAIEGIIREGLESIGPFCDALARGKYSIY